MFLLALVYNCVHATALFYQVVTLNVAVNSYSNALLTLLMSNQFVEIKSTVFKKIEKENLFQMTCADVVERFQLWLMLTIIALRNIVEVGGLSINFGAASVTSSSTMPSSNATGAPIRGGGILPNSFTLIPQWSGQVLSPFLLVLGSEMLVDWIKHAYINKFNSTKPAIYGRFLDVLAKDYYSNVRTPWLYGRASPTDDLGICRFQPHQAYWFTSLASCISLYPSLTTDLPHVSRDSHASSHPVNRDIAFCRICRH